MSIAFLKKSAIEHSFSFADESLEVLFEGFNGKGDGGIGDKTLDDVGCAGRASAAVSGKLLNLL